MERFVIESSHKYIPTVLLDPVSRTFELVGQCYMEHTDKFFQPIFIWVDEYLLTKHDELTLNIKLSYFNTSAVKCIWELLNRLKKYNQRQGGEVVVNWYFDEEDDNMLDIYYDFEDEIPLNFNHIHIEE